MSKDYTSLVREALSEGYAMADAADNGGMMWSQKACEQFSRTLYRCAHAIEELGGVATATKEIKIRMRDGAEHVEINTAPFLPPPTPYTCGHGNHVWTRPEGMGEWDMPPAWPLDQQICECGEMPFPRDKALAHPHGWEDTVDDDSYVCVNQVKFTRPLVGGAAVAILARTLDALPEPENDDDVLIEVTVRIFERGTVRDATLTDNGSHFQVYE